MKATKIQLKKYNCYYIFEDFGKAQTIIFSNSLGADTSMWNEQVQLLKYQYNILRYDTRGHGQSSSPQEAYTVADLGEDIIQLLDYLKLEKVAFCGLSMGGLIGQWLGINYPERFSHIILANTAAKIGNEQGWNDRISYVKANGLENILGGTAERWFTPAFRQKQPQKVQDVLTVFIGTDLQGYMNCCAVVRDADFRGQLLGLNVPVLVISGQQDAVTTPADGDYLQQQIPVAEHRTTNAAHLSSVEQGAEFSQFILSFIQ